MLQYILSVCIFIQVTKCDYYQLPTPTFESFTPKGFRMTIPNEEGIQMVAFFVNFNKELGDTNGEYTKYIVRPTNNFWVYDNTILRLKKNDKIYVKVLVLKNEVQYINDRIGPFMAKDLVEKTPMPTPMPAPMQTPMTTQIPTRMPTQTQTPLSILSPANNNNACQESLTTITHMSLDLEEQLIEAKENTAILKRILSREPQTVKISGIIAQGYTTKENLESSLNNKLQLTNIKLKSATKYPDYVEVTLFDVNDKLTIIKSVKRYLGGQSQQINVIY